MLREHSPVTFRITGTDHTGITVADLDRALAFWHGVLGFEIIRRARLSGRYAAGVTGVEGAEIDLAVLEAPGHRIELLQYNAPADRTRVSPRACDVGSQHVAFQIDDMDAALEAVAAAGWHPAGVPQVAPDGARAGSQVAYVRDPDGTTIELIQPA